MKRIVIVLVLMITTAGAGFALDNIAIQVFGESSINATGMDFNNEDGNLSVDDFRLEGISPIFWGLTTKLIFDKVGFGWTAQVNWNEKNSDFFVDYDFSLYLSYHFFKMDRPVDLFVEAGIGSMGQINVDKAYDYSESEDKEERDVDFIALSLYPHMGLGFAFKPGIFTIGARLTWRPVAGKIPKLDFYETSMLEFGIFIGCTFNIKIKHDDNDLEEIVAEEYIEENDNNADYEKAREEAEDFLIQMEEETSGSQEEYKSDDVKVKVDKNNNQNKDVDININVNVQ